MKSLFFAKRKLFGLCLVFCSVLCIGFTGLPGFANTTPSIDSLRKQQQEINQKRDQTIQQRDRLQGLQEAAQNRLTGLQQNLQITRNLAGA